MQQDFNKQQSITSFARERAKSLAFKIFAVGTLGTFLLGLTFGVYYYHGQLSQTVDVVSKSLGQPMSFGGDYLPTQILRTLVESRNFEDAWVTLPDGNLQFEEHALEERPLFKDIEESTFYWVSRVPHVLVSKGIFYHDAQVGKLHVGYRIPVRAILFFALGICLLFSIIAAYLYHRILRLARNVANPIREYSSALDSENDKEQFLKEGNIFSRFSEIAKLNEILLKYIRASKESEMLAREAVSKAQIAKVATRVKHDVIASLVIGESAVERLRGSGEQIHILKSVFERISNTIEDIPKIGSLTFDEMNSAATGSEVISEPHEIIRPCHIVAYIHQIVGEVKFSNICKNKSIQFEIHSMDDAFHAFCEVEPNKFKRDLLNLYKNAVEAISNQGTVTTTLKVENENLYLSIQDNGKGIPQNIIDKVCQRGFSFDKENGSGIGLTSAIEDIRNWRGQLEISSTHRKGTTVNISIPLSEEDFLFPTSLALSPNLNIIVVDDDPLVHRLWQNRFYPLGLKNHTIEVSYAKDLSRAKIIIDNLREQEKDFILLIDNDLKDDRATGLDFVQEMKIESNAILVTSNGNSSCLYEKCSQANLSIMPKAILEQVPIQVCH